MEAKRAELQSLFEDEEFDDEDFNGYLMYPKVFTDYMTRHEQYGPVRALPTKNFFYGMDMGEQISISIDPGVTLEVRCQAMSEPDEKGEVKVFFELNGQPRNVRVADRSAAASVASNVKAEMGNPKHVGAPMPGVVATVAVTAGQKVSKGDVLLTIEAMKMETSITADQDGVIKALHVSPGSQIDAKDLMVEFE